MDTDWVRDRIVAALKESGAFALDRTDHRRPLFELHKFVEDLVEHQANAVMVLLKETATERDTYHAFVGYLNTLRLEREDG